MGNPSQAGDGGLQQVQLSSKDLLTEQLTQRCAELETVEQDLRHQIAQLESRYKQLEGQLAQAKNDVAAEQMLSEIDKLAAAKQQAEQRAQQAEELAKEKADLADKLAATEKRVTACEGLQELLNKREAELAFVRQQADGLAVQLATTQERCVRAQVAAEEADKGRAEAYDRAEAAEAQLQEAVSERDEAVQHLTASQRIVREFEGHLRAVAAERDTALAKVQQADSKLKAAAARLQQAEEQEASDATGTAANARRTEELGCFQREADSLAAETKAREYGLAGKEKAVAVKLKEATDREAELQNREAVMQERLVDAAQREQAVAELRQTLLQQQRDVEKQRAALAAERAHLEVAQAQLEREVAAAAQDRATLTELRNQRLSEQEALITTLAEERAAAASQQAEAERAVDAAKRAELSAAKVLADLKAQADGARKQVEAAERRLEQLQERCLAEETRLVELREAGNEHQRLFEEQAQALLELGSNVKSQSEEVAAAYTQLQKDKEGLQKERQKFADAKAELQSQQRTIDSRGAELKETLQEVQEHQLTLALEKRKAAEEKVESRKAAEALQQAQVRLAAYVQASASLATSLGPAPAAAEAFHLLRDTGFPLPAPLALAATEAGYLAGQVARAREISTLVQPAPAALEVLHATDSPAPSPARTENSPPCSAAVHHSPWERQASQAGDESQRYRLLLADLESSIDTWRAQLSAGQPLTITAATPRTSFRQLLVPERLEHSPSASADKPQEAELSPGPCAAGQPQAQPPDAAAQTALPSRPPSPSRGVQTSVSYVDSIKLASSAAGAVDLPQLDAALARQFSAGKAKLGQAVAAEELEEPVIAVPKRERSGSYLHRGGGGSRISLVLPAVASHAHTRDDLSPRRGSSSEEPVMPSGDSVLLDASYSIPGKQESMARKWLKFRGASSPQASATAASPRPGSANGSSRPSSAARQQQGGSPAASKAQKGGKSWPHIFSFRKSGDGAPTALQSRGRVSSEEDFTITSASDR
ncbi:hypothetical protein N2152v2_008626 [Parachlorella kessleri]